MPRNLAKVIDAKRFFSEHASSIRVGLLVRIDEKGRAWVDYPGCEKGPVQARVVASHWLPETHPKDQGASVLLVFENHDLSLPIIVGKVEDKILVSKKEKTALLPIRRPKNALIDGVTVTLDAYDEIQLRCGKSSITLTKNGKVVVKGIEVVSRGTRVNKIKGGAVQIN
jgi:hypothetical protein